LRERREDLGMILSALVPKVAQGAPERISFKCDAVRALYRYEWPLNVRELEKCLMSAVVLSGGGPIGTEHLPEALRALLLPEEAVSTVSSETRPLPGATLPLALSPEDVTRRAQIVALLQENHGNITAVAKAMGKARMQVQRWLKRYRIDARTFK
jgi:DNA-binding NtrC family response regulator